jgi:hypothetical protein
LIIFVDRKYFYKYLYETCAWTPNRVFLAIIVMESQGLGT